ncbi:MAG: hypothetical protein BMS9Abin31_0638 [Gammaproteobacteria bacterium]|nr:MAG: hypothetical protein BMS9Abin31_0638 [Gammaproteobacteria bacterium]
MYTRCPECSTCFRVTDRHLAIAKGKVRCGKCQFVFNAPEHAIDDLPVNQVTEPTKTGAKKVTPLAPTEKEKKEAIAKATEVVKTKTTKDKKPIFDAGATMIADASSVDKNELDNIDLDSPSDNLDKMDDGLFDDSFDLNAAIDELTQSTDDNASDETADVDVQAAKTKPEKYLPEKNNNGDVFNTDAYDATNAASVADILNEMEGQLSLNIDEPDNNDKKEYDANKEFDFLNLEDDEPANESINENTVDEFEIIEFSEDEDELFDQSDFQDSDVEENIVLEEIVLNDDELKNTGKHADENEVPFQLRNDLERLHAPSRRLFSPVFAIPFVIFLLLLSFSQLAYFRAHELVNLVPSARPVLEAFCETVGCYYSGPRDTKQIELLSRDVRLHPKEKNALLISAAIINNAYFAQPYPDIHIRLSDISGNVVAERTFNAKTYMGKLSNPFLLMKSKTPVHINFEVVDPGKDAINFEFTFL